jgi:chorismate--pyruvate lyase
VREVLLCANGIPLVMAHSVIPTLSSSGSNHAILRLGTKPLGAVLFSKTHKHSKAKAPLDIARLDKSSELWQRCSKHFADLSSPLWARRTLYRLKGHPILVNEIFLPALLKAANS